MNTLYRPRSILIILLLAALPLSAATFTVTNTNDSGAGSLRQALNNANSHPGEHRIEFAIGSGPQTIQPITVLPNVGLPVVIDGRTQPGYTGTPLIEIDGSLIAGNWSTVVGLDVANAQVYGLVLNNFVGRAIEIDRGLVQNCYIGTNASGTAKKANHTGILAYFQVTIGGAGPGEGNLISGNIVGVRARAPVSIQGNTFGSNAARTAAIDGTSTHVSIENFTNGYPVIGNLAPNVFAGGEMGVSIFYSDNVRVEGNYFGTTPGGVSMPIRTAIEVYQSSQNIIYRNVIRGSELGIIVSGNALRNRIWENSMSGNGFGIELYSGEYPYGQHTPNDAGDSDTGPNNLVNHPLLGRVTKVGSTVTVPGTISATPNRVHRIELFSSPDCNASGYGDGKTFLTAFDVTTDGSGTAAFTRNFSGLAVGSVVTATATTDLEGTSEFSACSVVEGPGLFTFKTSANAVEGGILSATVQRLNGAVGAASVSFAVTGGTAGAADFTGGNGTLEFADGETTKTFTIPTTEDGVYEGSETIVLTLSGATNGTSVGAPSALTLTIHDDEPSPVVLVEDAEVIEGDDTKIFQFPIMLEEPAGVPFTAGYFFLPLGATPGADYSATSGSVTFAPGETLKHVPVTIVGDTLWEPNEAIAFYLTAQPSFIAAFIGIVNDDPQPAVSADHLQIAEGNGTSTATITLRATQPATGWVRVRLLNGSARVGSDFEPYVNELYFSNETETTFAITIFGDEEAEPDESFVVEVVSLSDGLLAGGNGFVTLLNDDVGVGPAERWIPAGESEEFTIRLGQAPSETVTIGLTSDSSAASIPASLVIPAGQVSADFAVAALVPGETANITVTFPPSLGGQTRSVRVRTYAKATLHFSPPRLTVFDGQTATVSVSLDPPSSAATTLGLRSTDAVEVPRSLTIPAGGSTSFVVTAKRIGSFTIDAQLPAVHGNEVQPLYGEVIAEPVTPAIVSLTPSHGPVAGGTDVTIHGVNLRSECTVAFGGVPAASVTFTSATQMSAITPPHAGGSVAVTLTCGADSFTLPNGFGYVSEAARVESVMPSSGTTAGGTHVRVAGTNFDGSCWLFFGRSAATNVVVRDPESITGVAPPHAAGASDATVRCSGGTSTLAAAFTYRAGNDPAPLITEVVPAAAAPGELVTIRGLNFRPTDTAAIDTTPAAIVDPSPETHVVRVPDLPAGLASVFVTDLLGRTTTSGPVFSVLEARPPRITAVSPASVPAGAELELAGDGFRPGYSFEMGGHPAAIVALEYTRAIVRVSRNAEPGAHPVQVRNRTGALAAIGPDVTIVDGGIVIASADPRCVTTDGGVYATIRGSGFPAGASATFDGVPAPEVIVVDDETLRVIVPSGAAGPATISVNGSTLTDGFRYASPFDPRGCGGRTRGVRH